MASYPPILVSINGVLLNATDIQTARPVAADTDTDEPAGVLVHFISGGWITVPEITVEQLEAVLASAVKEAAPF